jgi:outer membrane protein OmpA-like peptidoglycan-associated protein
MKSLSLPAIISLAVYLLSGCISQPYQSQDDFLIRQSVESLLENDWDRTEAVASVALDINPRNAQAVYMLALVREHYGQKADASRLYRRIIELKAEETIPAGLVTGGEKRRLYDIAQQKLGLMKKATASSPATALRPEDTDGDGIADALDRCADTPRGAMVNASGCWTLQGAFDSGKSQLKAQALPMLDGVAALLKANPRMRIEIQGHTDSSGTYRHNLRLSRVRAQSVMRYLVQKGIAANRLTATGYGPNRPRGSNATSTGRALNRRIEFRVLAP